MAAKSTRGKHSDGFFRALDNLSSADFSLERKRRRKTIEGGRYFEVERIITSREGRFGTEFLVKWYNFSVFEATWEPEEHLNDMCLSYFKEPNPKKNTVLEDVGQLRVALAHSLKCPRTRQRLTMKFREDVFTYLFKGKGQTDGMWQVLKRSDFDRCFFPDGWDSLLDPHSQGTKVFYPVKIRHFISWSPKGHFVDGRSGDVVPAHRAYLEKMSMDFIKVAA